VARLAILSFRLGGTDGVSIEAAKWFRALTALGHDVTTVAGEGPVDVTIPGLALAATTAPRVGELEAALDGVDLVIVENLASLPLNVAARDALYRVLDRRLAIFHHHDLPWQREHLAHLDGPLDQDGWRHVTINEVSRRQLAERGIDAATIMNSFDCDPLLGDRMSARAAIDVDHEVVVLLPTRAIPRKNVPGALALCRGLDATFWLLGPAEDGYDAELETLVGDAYAACDLVVMPSTWEGFGNPVLESVTHRRPLALHPYPVAREIIAHGFEFFGLDDIDGIAGFISEPDEDLFERNLRIAREHFSESDLPRRLDALLNDLRISSPA